jgi:calcineurin-like phosphoesterase family protein
MSVWFTSDTHFGHENIIKYCDRPFDSVEEMDEALVSNWNEVVGHNDLVYHLGDFTLGGADAANDYFGRLNGYIHILGNWWHHDRCWLPPLTGRTIFRTASRHYVWVVDPIVVLDHQWRTPRHIRTATEHSDLDYGVIALCHYQMRVWDRSHYGSIHLYGHSHGQSESEGKSMDVGVDANDFYPVSLKDVLGWMADVEIHNQPVKGETDG